MTGTQPATTAPHPTPKAPGLMRRIWLRGFLPALLMLLLWIFSTGMWLLWFSTAPNKLRACFGQGFLMVNWNSTSTWRGIGSVKLNLGMNFTVKGVLVTWYANNPLWSFSVAMRTDPRLVIRPGHIQIPIYSFALLFAIPPTIHWIRRRRQIEPWQCRSCRYDLRHMTAPQCPECGTPVPTAIGEASVREPQMA